MPRISYAKYSFQLLPILVLRMSDATRRAQILLYSSLGFSSSSMIQVQILSVM